MSEESARFLTNGHIKVFLNDFGVSFVPAVACVSVACPSTKGLFFSQLIKTSAGLQTAGKVWIQGLTRAGRFGVLWVIK